MKKKYKYVICILVYKNGNDLKECIKSIDRHIEDYKIIIINSYYDDTTLASIRKIAESNDCDFINVPNKGYGYGNNRGICYAIENYNFDFLIVSNPDIIIRKFDDSSLYKYRNAAIGPMITTLKGKRQNPYWAVRNPFCEKIIYSGLKYKYRVILYCAYAINKLIRILSLFLLRVQKKQYMKVYALHGSFFIISKKVLDTIGIPYDENMFLFSEEAYLANKLFKHNIPSYICKCIMITHKEDGSMKLTKINENDEERKSFMYYFENKTAKK